MSVLAKRLFDVILQYEQKWYLADVVISRVENRPGKHLEKKFRVFEDEKGFVNVGGEYEMPEESLAKALFNAVRDYEKSNDLTVKQVDIWVEMEDITFTIETTEVIKRDYMKEAGET